MTARAPDPGRPDPELAVARARIAELEAMEADREQAARGQGALFRIAEAAGATEDLHAFYATIHAILGELMYADNCYIALYDDDRQAINFPYYVDAVDKEIPDPNAWTPFGVGDARGLTGYLLRTGQPALVTPQRFAELVDAKEVVLIGVISEGSWLGAPLVAEGRALGALVVQAYSAEHAYSQADLDLLAFVGRNIGTVVSRARAIEETRERNAELALINEIGEALARQLEFEAIIELVGARVKALFDVRSIFIALYDADTDLISWPYDIDEDERFDRGTRPLGTGITSTVIRSGRPLRLSSTAEQEAAGAIQIGGADTESWLGVPISTGDRVVGVVGLESIHANAFSESDERLLMTLASSRGVALDNARLFDETKRLLAEADARAAELAVINEIGVALAKQLDFEAIIELVGERIRGIFRANSMFVALYDQTADTITFPYDIDEGKRFDRGRFGSHPLGPGLTSVIIRTGKSLRFSTVEESRAAGAVDVGGAPTQSWLGVPIPAGDRVVGVVGMESLQTHAYTESDERVLATLASSMGVALENARLFDETKRLLIETDERAAELAIINGVQEGLAAQI